MSVQLNYGKLVRQIKRTICLMIRLYLKIFDPKNIDNEVEWKESKIFSHLNIDLANLWMKK